MVQRKTINQDAKVGNEDLTATFQFIKTDIDGYGAAINELAFALHIKHDDGSSGYGRVVVDDILIGGERSDLNSLLVKLRDAVLSQLGYIDV